MELYKRLFPKVPLYRFIQSVSTFILVLWMTTIISVSFFKSYSSCKFSLEIVLTSTNSDMQVSISTLESIFNTTDSHFIKQLDIVSSVDESVWSSFTNISGISVHNIVNEEQKSEDWTFKRLNSFTYLKSLSLPSNAQNWNEFLFK